MYSITSACNFLFLAFSTELTEFIKADVHTKDSAGADLKGLAIHSDFNLVAIGYRDTIAIHNYSLKTNSLEKIGILITTIPLLKPISESGYIEFKFLTNSELFYCDTSSCSLCSTTAQNSSCTPLLISWNGKVSSSMSGVSAARCSRKLFIRVAEPDRAAVISFSLDSSRLLKPEQCASDAPYMSGFSTVLGFSRAKYCYFVGSTTQPYEPLINANLGVEKRINSKIIR